MAAALDTTRRVAEAGANRSYETGAYSRDLDGGLDVATVFGTFSPLTSIFSVELPGIEPDALPGRMPSKLRFRSVSVRFVPVRYLRFRFRVLIMKRSGSSKRRGSRLAAAKLAPRGSTRPSPAGDHGCLFLFHKLRRKHVSTNDVVGYPRGSSACSTMLRR